MPREPGVGLSVPAAHCPLHVHPVFRATLSALFGAGVRMFDLAPAAGPAALMPMMATSVRRPPALAPRFDLHPGDAAFVARRPRFRLPPLRQVSPPVALEAGNLRGGLLVEGGDRPTAAAGLLAALAARPDWDFAVLPTPLPDALAWTSAADAAGLPWVLRRTGRTYHYRDAPPDWDGVLTAASRNLRRNAQRIPKRLAEARLEVRLREGAEGLAPLRAVAEASWKTGAFRDAPVRVPFTARQEALHAALAADRRLRVAVFTLEQAGRPLAAMHWILCGDALCAGLTFHAPEARALSPGHALMEASFRWALAAGARRVDFNATDGWLADYADRTVTFGALLLLRRGPLGALLARLARMADPGIGPPPAVVAEEE
ncbi:MAG: GNAT family N-acetyltransferase [Rhodobacteraceae bacterium]|nr:MAG: GNAT family N-acetyltransferase [Paracoccaceae bacterium]